MASSTTNTSVQNVDKYKTRLCRHALRGKDHCTRGVECQFLHEGDEGYAKEFELRQEKIASKSQNKESKPNKPTKYEKRERTGTVVSQVSKRPTKQITITTTSKYTMPKPDILSVDQLDKLVRACKALPESCDIDLEAIMSACDTLKTSIGKINEFMEFVNVVTKPN